MTRHQASSLPFGRRVLPGLIWPLAVLATALSGALWLRTFPADTIAVPIFGAAVLSVLVSAAAVWLTGRSVLVTAPIAVAGYLIYTLTIVLRDPFGFNRLVDGFTHGPSRLLSFALPLVSPLSLMVAPVALCWAVGAIAGECLARQRSSWVPYPVWLLGFAVSYAGTARAYLDGGHSNRAADTALGAGLLATLAVLRTLQVWTERDESAVPADGENALPVRSIAAGVLVAAVAVAAGTAAIQPTSSGRPRAVQREPAVRQSDPVTPVAFVAALRPPDRTATGSTLFAVSVDRSSSPYICLASTDFYDGDSWSFERSFRPSGGVIPADVDPTLTVRTQPITQHYRIAAGPLARSPWMPYLARPERVSGQSVNVDPGSAMIVPADSLSAGASYVVTSQVATTRFDQLEPTWLAATSPPPVDTQLPSSLRATLTDVLAALAAETGTDSGTPAAFLNAVVDDLRSNYALTDPRQAADGPGASATTPVPSPSALPSAAASGSVSGSPGDAATSGGTSFAAVLASILGDRRAGTPEQYATLVAVVARAVGIPARLVTGFRIGPADQAVGAGDHDVTASMAYTWVEIPVRGAGWVVVDPTPTRYADGAARNTVGAQSSPPPTTSAPPTNNALVTQASNGQAVAPKSRVDQAAGRSWWWLAWAIPAAIAGLALAWGAAVMVGKAVRRGRRRRLTDPRAQVVGAWHESLDTLSEAGLYGLANLTGAEVTTSTEARFGVESAGAVAVLSTTANRALFGEHSLVHPEDADAAWRANANLRKAVHQSLGWRARIGAAVRFQRAGRHR